MADTTDSLAGKVAVITGATSGIGEAAARELARRGATLWIVARDEAKADRLMAALGGGATGAPHRTVIADLSLCAEAYRAGNEIASAAPKVDILLNNAGALFDRRVVTSEGLERTFALNHMAYFSLTEALLPSLLTAGARIVSTASSSHSHASLDLDDLQNETRVGFANAYGRSKLANILWTRELARRLSGTGVTATCFHPGFVRSEIGEELGPGLRQFFKLAQIFARSTRSGADTAVYLASSPEIASEAKGAYWIRRRVVRPSAEARSDELARRLWEASQAILDRVRHLNPAPPRTSHGRSGP